MTTWLRHVWSIVSGSYWFVPVVMIAGAAVLGMTLLGVDVAWNPDPLPWPLYGGSADGARALLSTIASSVITVAGVAFSITVVALAQASSQFGPRLLRNFMSDRGNQLVLGTFTATFVYCLLVVRTVRGDSSGGFVPHLSVTVAVMLAIASILVLIYFIHHVAHGLQAPVVAARAAAELRSAIRAAFPERVRPESAEADRRDAALLLRNDDGDAANGFRVDPPRGGYVQAVNLDAIVSAAEAHDLHVRLAVRPGHFVTGALPIAVVRPAHRCTGETASRIAGAVLVGSKPTAEQDIEFFVRQLVEIACRALSPGVNDPFTAMECVDWLAAALADAARRDDPLRCVRDATGAPRVVLHAWDFDGLVGAAFNPVRQSAATSMPVTIRILERLADLAAVTRSPERVAAIRAQVEAIETVSSGTASSKLDRTDLEQRRKAVLERLRSR